MDINMNIAAVNPNVSSAANATTAKPVGNAAEAAGVQSTEKSTTEKISFAQEDIVAISDDGDTVQASKAGRNASGTAGELVTASEDGAVTLVEQPEDNIKAVEEVEEDDENTAQQKVSNLSGYSKQQIEQLYHEGKISRYMYDKNVEAREEREEAMNTSTDSREEIASQITAQEAFVQSMGQISARAQNIANTNQGIIEAMANGREDIAEKIFISQT